MNPECDFTREHPYDPPQESDDKPKEPPTRIFDAEGFAVDNKGQRTFGHEATIKEVIHDRGDQIVRRLVAVLDSTGFEMLVDDKGDDLISGAKVKILQKVRSTNRVAQLFGPNYHGTEEGEFALLLGDQNPFADTVEISPSAPLRETITEDSFNSDHSCPVENT